MKRPWTQNTTAISTACHFNIAIFCNHHKSDWPLKTQKKPLILQKTWRKEITAVCHIFKNWQTLPSSEDRSFLERLLEIRRNRSVLQQCQQQWEAQLVVLAAVTWGHHGYCQAEQRFQ